jgi:hypothetical protein
MPTHLRILAVLTVAAFTAACDESLSTIAGPTPNLEPTFSSIQREIFETTDTAGRTACVTCHTNVGRIPAGGLNLLATVSYDQLVNFPSIQRAANMRVLPGNPEESYMIQKLEDRVVIVGRRMPFNGPPYLTPGQISIIRRWIEIGAPRN